MRILTVCNGWRVFGAETITLRMVEGFKRRGHDQLVVSSIWTDGEFGRQLSRISVADIPLSFGPLVASIRPEYIKWTADVLLRLPRLWIRWSRIIRKFCPDIVIFTGSKQPLLVLPLLRKTDFYVIEFTNLTSTAAVRWLYRSLSMRTKGFIAVSAFMRSHLGALGAPAEKIYVVKSGAFFSGDQPGASSRDAVDSTATAQQREAVQNPSPLRRLGIVGQVSRTKGHEVLIEATRLLQRRGVDFEVVVFGSGVPEYVQQVKRKLADAEVEHRWQWRGYLSDRRTIYSSVDVVIVPSCFGDPFPTVAMEAGAFGLPVIASRIGGLPEIVEDGVSGCLVDVQSSEQIADCVQWLFSRPDVAAKMGEAARARVLAQFTVEKMVSELEALFSGHLQQAPTNTRPHRDF